MNQISTVIRKNLKILFKTKTFVKSLYLPFVTALLAIVGSNKGNTYVLLKIFTPLYQVTAVNGYVRHAMMELVTEKNERQKELQKIMGLSQLNYMLGNWISSVIITLALGMIYIIPTFIGGVYPGLTFLQVMGPYLLFLISIISQVYCFSCFFTNPRISGDIISVLNFVFTILYMLIYKDTIRESSLYISLISIFPQSGISFTYFSKSWLISTNTFDDFNFTYEQGIISLAGSMIGYMIIYLYFDQVWPNDFGTQKKPWFFIEPILNLCRSRNANNDDEQDIDIENNYQIPLREANDQSSAQFNQGIRVNNLKRLVEISGLIKKFAGFVAVDNVSFNLYEGEIFCLLGHNGAGKSTLINIICGMQNKTRGTVIMNGLNTDDHMEEIRKSIGFCSQKNILYNMMTVEGHLQYYSNIKGVFGTLQIEDMEMVIQKCMLQNERKKIAIHLSGGNRRKLCLAIALIGKGKIIFLDEPTAGVDPVTRSQIWDILKDIRNEGRVIVLTTHHLEEAETLANRVCIMSQGKLIALGTVEYITKQFGTGYFLKLSNKEDTPEQKNEFLSIKSELKHIIHENVPDSQIDPQTQENVIRVLLPFSSQDKFSYLFEKIEQYPTVLINLQMNTLEDVFVNIGMDEQKFLSENTNRKQDLNINHQENNTDKNLNSNPCKISIGDVEESWIKFSNFSGINIPNALLIKPSFSMISQVSIIVKRKFKYIINNKSNIFSFTFPFIFIFFGSLFQSEEGIDPKLFLALLSFALAFHSINFVGLIIYEKEKHLKYALRVMGCKMSAYWIGNIIAELITCVFLTLISYIIFLSLGTNLQEFNTTQIEYICYVAFITFSWLSASLFYSRMFNSLHETVIGLPFFLLFVIFYGSLLCISLGQWGQIIPLLVSPTIIMYMGVFLKFHSNIDFYYWLGDNGDYYIIYSIIQSVIFLILSVILEYYPISNLFKKIQSPPNETNLIDQDVLKEKQRMLSSTDPIKAIALSKTFPNLYTAINHVTFGVEKKQIFGLLGSNGAGKSTTFNILTAREEQFSGSVNINNHEVSQFNESIWSNSGICPQQDCLWENLSPNDHLEIYAALKGLSGQQRTDVINYYLKTMQLEQYRFKKSMNLSGGNKRKLSVCMSLIGGPNVMFLDEPSSGLDPIAKRFLWQTLKQSIEIKNSSIVLTTHSMGEAESLCNKIGILVNGSFACMGSPEHLSSRFGNGYRLSLKIKPSVNPEEVNVLVMQSIPNAQIIKSLQPDTLTYQIHEKFFVFSHTFAMIRDHLQKFIHDYSLHHANLEQIFQYFAGFQQPFIGLPQQNTVDEICNCQGSNAARMCSLICCCPI